MRPTRGSYRRDDRAPGPPPSRDALHEAALAYLGRSAASSTMLGRALERRITTWARRAERASIDAEEIAAGVSGARDAVRQIIARFREVGLLDDAGFAEARAGALSRSGRSRRAIAAHLEARGIDGETARRALGDDPGAELRAAVTFARKRRIGPFAREQADRAARQKALAAMARGGFDFRVSERTLAMSREEAEEHLRDR